MSFSLAVNCYYLKRSQIVIPTLRLVFLLFIDLVKYFFSFSNPLVPCDAITIPKVDLYAWKEDHYGHPVHHAAPVHTVHHSAPLVHHASAALHHTSSYAPTPAPYYEPAPAQAPHYAPAPAPAPYSATPAPYTPTVHASQYTSTYTSPYSAGGSGTIIKPFVHTPLHSFHGTVGKK